MTVSSGLGRRGEGIYWLSIGKKDRDRDTCTKLCFFLVVVFPVEVGSGGMCRSAVGAHTTITLLSLDYDWIEHCVIFLHIVEMLVLLATILLTFCFPLWYYVDKNIYYFKNFLFVRKQEVIFPLTGKESIWFKRHLLQDGIIRPGNTTWCMFTTQPHENECL